MLLWRHSVQMGTNVSSSHDDRPFRVRGQLTGCRYETFVLFEYEINIFHKNERVVPDRSFILTRNRLQRREILSLDAMRLCCFFQILQYFLSSSFARGIYFKDTANENKLSFSF